jgi:hypothetical protein
MYYGYLAMKKLAADPSVSSTVRLGNQFIDVSLIRVVSQDVL